MPKVKSVKDLVWKKLDEVLDPELYISITDLGLIYDVIENNGVVNIKMTLTTMGCPLFSVLETDIMDKVKSVKGVKTVLIDLVFDPPWTIEMMTERGRAILGI